MKEKRIGAASHFEVAAGTEHSKTIGELIREWLQIHHADKLGVVDPTTGKWTNDRR